MVGKSHTWACGTSKDSPFNFVQELGTTFGLASSMLTTMTKKCPKMGQIGPLTKSCRVAHHWNQNFVGYNNLKPKPDRRCHFGQQ